MTNEASDFFASKDNHPWSRIKDRILGSYMSPYLAKISKKRNPILLIDAFAGPGRTEDGEAGSPLLICQAAERYAGGRYQAILINNEENYHLQLKQALDDMGCTSAAQPVLADSTTLLPSLIPKLTTQSVFLYIDPFGLEWEFDAFSLLLNRNANYSTEILINLHMPIIHRLAAREKFLSRTGDLDQIRGWHGKLSRTLGGDYWKDLLLSESDLETKVREQLLVNGYLRQLSKTDYLTYTGFCPVQASRASATKYYMIFASPHPDAMLLMNDHMCKAFNEYMHVQEISDTLFAGQHWSTWRESKRLQDLVVQYVNKYPNRARKELWLTIVRDHFMRFTSSEYIKAVKELVDTGGIVCTTPIGSPIRKTKRLNDNCVLAPA